MPHKFFLCVPTGEIEYRYARFSNDGVTPCAGRKDGSIFHRGETTFRLKSEADVPKEWPPLSDPVWPTKCDFCGLALTDENSNRSTGSTRIYKRHDTGEVLGVRNEFPIGACYDADWYPEDRRGPDGRYLIVKTPGGSWRIDSRASNCTMPNDNEHRCWVRHGRPEDGTLHVDKNGNTCAAGAGSIMCGDYHGFLHNGQLT